MAFMGINPAHKGYCTPMTKSTCTPHRKALAKRLKKGGDLYKGKKKADGGLVDGERDLRAASDSLTMANKNNPWVKRYLQGNTLSIPDPYNPGSGKTSSHGLSYHPYSKDSAMIFPEIIQQGDRLVKLDNDAAREYAIKNKTGINTDLELAKYYSENGLIKHAYGGWILPKEYQFGGEVSVANNVVRTDTDLKGVPLKDIFTFSKDMTEQSQLQGSQELLNRKNQIMWANYKGKFEEYPPNKPPNKFEYTPAILADMKKRGLTKEYIESWQPENYPEEFGLGGIIGDVGAGALGGAALGPWGAIAGGAVGLIKGLVGNKREKEQEALIAQQLEMQNTQNINPPGMILPQSMYPPTFGCGGKVKRMPYGGTVDTEVVELETGEPFRTPDGTIGVVKEDDGLSHKNGGVTIPLEVGTQILGKKKDPDTKMMYKELGKKLAMQKKKYDKILEGGAGTYSVNAAKAMNAKIDNKFQSLFAKQESAKARRAPQAPQAEIPKAGDGLGIGNFFDSLGGLAGFGATKDAAASFSLPKTNITAAGAGVGGPNNYTPSDAYFNKTALGDWWDYSAKPNLKGWGNAAAQLAPVGYNLIQGMRPSEQLTASDYYNPREGEAIASGRSAVDALANRRFDINPMLEGNLTQQAIGDYNARTSAYTPGQLDAQRRANMAQRMRGDMAAWGQKQNMENQYQAQLAQGLFNYGDRAAQLGQQRANTDFMIDDYNLQSEAARRNFLGASMTGISDYAQRNKLMQGQQAADEKRLAALKGLYPMFERWFGKMSVGA